VTQANQINGQARTTLYECYPECQSFLLPHLQPDSKQKEREMESVSVVSATGFIPLDKKVQGLLWKRHCRKHNQQSILFTLSCRRFSWQHATAAWKPLLLWLQLARGQKKAFLSCSS